MGRVADLVTRLLLDTKGFDNNLTKSKGKIEKFKKNIDSAGKGVKAFGSSLGVNVGMITKFGGAIGVAAAAGAGLKKVIESNQITGDMLSNTIATAKISLDNFAAAIGTADFSGLITGFGNTWEKARDLAEVLDQLTNTKWSYNIISQLNELEIAQNKLIINDPKASKADKEAAKTRIEAITEATKDAAKTATKDVENAIKGLLVQGTNLRKEDINSGGEQVIRSLFDIDVNAERDRIKKEIDAVMKARAAEIEKAQKNTPTIQVTDYRTNPVTGMTEEYIKIVKDTNALQKTLNEIDKKYQDAILKHQYLNAMSDERQQQLVGYVQEYIQMVKTQVDTDTKAQRATNKLAEGAKSTSTAAGEKAKAEEGSVAYLQEQVNLLQKQRDSVKVESAEWRAINIELEKYIKLLEIAKFASSDAYVHPKAQKGAELALEVAPIPDLNNILDSGMSDIKERLKSDMNIKPTIDVWSEFNNVLANTSTIATNMAAAFADGTQASAQSIMQMVATTVPAIASLIVAFMTLAQVEGAEKAVNSSKHWIEAIAAVISVTATIGAAIAGAVSMSKKFKGAFAEGGIVGGNSWAGDREFARVNSGEMILTRAQQANLFKQINHPMSGGNDVVFHISGDDLIGVYNNKMKKNRLTR